VLADNGRSDLPRLAKALGHEPRALLPLVEASEWLGFARAEQGDLVLLELGKTYAGAGIQVRKELIAGRILRLPLIRWIYEKLQNDDNQRIDRSFFVEALRSEFGGETDDQIDTVIGWGRYAELFGYDKDSDELYLES